MADESSSEDGRLLGKRPAAAPELEEEEEEEEEGPVVASNRRGRKKKKKKKKPRDSLVVARERFNRDWDKAGVSVAHFASELANSAQTEYKGRVIKPATDRHIKILYAFRDKPYRDSTIASVDRLDAVLRGYLQYLVVFDVVLKRGAKTKLVNTLKKLHITGHVRGEDPDQLPMGGALPEDYDPYEGGREPLKAKKLDFWLELNGVHWMEEGALEEMFYFLVNKKSADPNSARRPNRDDDGDDPTRAAFDDKIGREKDAGHYELNYNFCRDTTITLLGNYLSFLHALLETEMGHHVPLISLHLILQWVRGLMFTHIY